MVKEEEDCPKCHRSFQMVSWVRLGGYKICQECWRKSINGEFTGVAQRPDIFLPSEDEST